jgi:hypothetical protein
MSGLMAMIKKAFQEEFTTRIHLEIYVIHK